MCVAHVLMCGNVFSVVPVYMCIVHVLVCRLLMCVVMHLVANHHMLVVSPLLVLVDCVIVCLYMARVLMCACV